MFPLSHPPDMTMSVPAGKTTLACNWVGYEGHGQPPQIGGADTGQQPRRPSAGTFKVVGQRLPAGGGLLNESSQTVARWEKGQSTIDGAADRLLRLIYESVTANKGVITKKVKDVLEQLAELDNCREDLMEFEDTSRGWRPFADVA